MLRKSEQSIKRFISFLLSIKEPALRLHQTLTFRPLEHDERRAQRLFRELMDNIHNRPRFMTVGSLYVRDVSEKDGIHYHVSFYFFDRKNGPFYFSQTEDKMRALVFTAWNEKQRGRLAQRANKLINRTDTPYDYLLGKLESVKKGARREKTRWRGVWNREIFEKNKRHCTVKERQTLYRKHFGPFARLKPSDPSKPQRGVYTRANIISLAEEVEVNWLDWVGYKRERTGLSGDVTDDQLRENFNEKLKAGLSHREITGFD